MQGKRHAEGVREAPVERQRVREPEVVDGDDLGDHVVVQVQSLGDAATASAVRKETTDQLGR
ncbi:hypothetical protein [Streptacidiphilus fuscans]|uniref:hypothetical protein n=1 Tax=Streptacidiphilus fuscans TaxID=2789292 RepID=UPI001F1E480F|nr:hypothetical protein [Streptacidiphilus fuscans]